MEKSIAPCKSFSNVMHVYRPTNAVMYVSSLRLEAGYQISRNYEPQISLNIYIFQTFSAFTLYVLTFLF